MSSGPRRWRFEFRDPGLTHFGGMVLIQRFCQKLRLRWRFQRDVRLQMRDGPYWPADLVLALLYAVIAGLRRINKTEILNTMEPFLTCLDWILFLISPRSDAFSKRSPRTMFANWCACMTGCVESCSRCPRPQAL